jgi:hypothetical protein
MQVDTGSGGPYWPPSPQPTKPFSAVILTSSEFLSGKAACEEKKHRSPRGTRRMNVSIARIRNSDEALDRAAYASAAGAGLWIAELVKDYSLIDI